MSSVSSAEPTAQQNFNPSWMRPNAAANRGGLIGGHRISGAGGGGGYDDSGEDISSSSSAIGAAAAAVLSSPLVSEFSYTRERLLELAPTGSIMPDALRDQLFFNETNLPLVSNSPLSDLEQRLQHNINSSKAMSLLSHVDRAAIAAGAPYGSGYGGGASSPGVGPLQNGQSPTNKWVPKWNKSTPERASGGSVRGGSVGRAGGSFFAGRGGGRIGGEGGFGSTTNGGLSADDSGSPGAYQPKFSALRRGGGVGGVGRGGSTTGASFNTRADALYNPNDPTDRPKAVNTGVTRSESDDEEEEGWSKVGSTSRSSTNTTPANPERPAWARSESWIQRTQQQQQAQQALQQQQQQAQPPISQWNSREAGPESVWKDRNQMMASVKKNSTENPPLQQQQQQPPAQREDLEPEVPISMPSYPNSSTWSNSGIGGGIFYQPTTPSASASQVAPPAKEEPVEFYYVDPTETRRGPFPKEQMLAWFKHGYFTDETLRVQRGAKGEFKTIGELKKINGVSTPFDYPEDLEKARPAPAAAAPQMPSIPAYPSSTNPMFPTAPFGGMNMWSSMAPGNEMYSMMQTTLEQQMIAERQRIVEEHNRRLAEEAKKMAEFQEAMYRQLSIQQEMSQKQLREQELAIQRHREELERRDAELRQEAMARQQKMESEARELEERKALLEAEERRKRHVEEQKKMYEQKQREAIEKETSERMRRAEEAAEKERSRLEMEARQSEEKIRQRRALKEMEDLQKAEEERRKVAERERLAREAAAARQQAELEAVWTTKKVATVTTSSGSSAASKQVPSPTGSDDSEGWTAITKEVKHTKAAPWAAKVETAVKTEKTLLEIQLEEERKLKAEQEQSAKQKAKEQSANVAAASVISADKNNGGLWGSTKTWAAPETNSSSKSYVSPFLDGPSLEAANKIALQKKNSQPKMAVPAAKAVSTPVKTAANNKAKVAPSTPSSAQKTKKTKEETAADDLQQWFVKKFHQFSTDVDAMTLFTCIIVLENPNEVEDIVMSYLDESKTVKEFVREFIKRRIAMRAAGGRPDADDLTSARTAAAAPSDSNSGSNSNSGNGQGKKKKKSQKQVLDGNILGFRGTAASDRLNKGEIDAIPTAPVNPSRR